MFKKTIIQTPLGNMLAISDEHALYLLEFLSRKKLDKRIEKLLQDTKKQLVEGDTFVLRAIRQELKAYFSGQLKIFKTPIAIQGTAFQQKAWRALSEIPYGETQSYAKQAESLNQPRATRAVAHANANNSFAIMIPCHRVIRTDNTLGGYAAGIDRKAWLIQHEQIQQKEIKNS